MGGMSIWHWLVVGIIVMLLFGRGKISEMMGDVAKGIKAFKKGMTEDDTAAATPTTPIAPGEPVRTIDHQPGAPAQPTAATAAPASAPLGERKAG
ncbi:MAG TPA: twin-arginine translocase TatA/TatE family subunit [Beijerinckiaceae bacterium]|jgi:sec-independent protein translocase protein TatA